AMAFNKQKLMMREDEEQRKMALKYADLMPEYLQLQKEVLKVRKRLQTAKLKKDNLIGVVRFLKQKYRMLKKTSPDSKASENGLMNQYTRTSPPMDQFESVAVEAISKETAASTKFGSAMTPTYEETTAITNFQNAIVPTYEETTANVKFQYAMTPTFAEATATAKFQYTMAPTHEHTTATTKFQYAIAAPTHEKTSAFQESMPDANLSLGLYNNSKIDQLAFENILEPRRIMNPTFVQSNKPFPENIGLGTVKRPAILKNNSKKIVKPVLGKRKISWEDKISLTL
ncbi:hypothetical protein KI387_030940, partial [Taxus chinensis]